MARPRPFFWFLPFAKTANIPLRDPECFSQRRGGAFPCRAQFRIRYAQTLLRRKPVKPPRIPQQRPVAISSHAFDNPPHRRLNLFQPRASLLDLAHVSRG